MKKVFQAYIKGTIEAVEFYKKAFNAELGRTGVNEDGTYLHAEIVKDDEYIMFLSEKSDNTVGDTMQFLILFDGDRNAVDQAYKVLSKDSLEIGMPVGKLPWGSYGASLVDKFGISWFISE